MNQRNRYRRHKIALPVFALVAALLLGLVIRWLWNAILPSVANVNPINYWQAVGLFVLCKILFGSFGGPMRHRDPRSRWRRFNRGFGPEATEDAPSWRNKWMKMTDEERVRFRQEMWKRCRKPPENI